MVSRRQEVFLARLVEINCEDAIPFLNSKGWTTYAAYAFATDYNPNMADSEILTKKLLEPASGGNEKLVPHLRMLWHQAWAISTKEMEISAGRTPSPPPKLSYLV